MRPPAAQLRFFIVTINSTTNNRFLIKSSLQIPSIRNGNKISILISASVVDVKLYNFKKLKQNYDKMTIK